MKIGFFLFLLFVSIPAMADPSPHDATTSTQIRQQWTRRNGSPWEPSSQTPPSTWQQWVAFIDVPPTGLAEKISAYQGTAEDAEQILDLLKEKGLDKLAAAGKTSPEDVATALGICQGNPNAAACQRSFLYALIARNMFGATLQQGLIASRGTFEEPILRHEYDRRLVANGDLLHNTLGKDRLSMDRAFLTYSLLRDMNKNDPAAVQTAARRAIEWYTSLEPSDRQSFLQAQRGALDTEDPVLRRLFIAAQVWNQGGQISPGPERTKMEVDPGDKAFLLALEGGVFRANSERVARFLRNIQGAGSEESYRALNNPEDFGEDRLRWAIQHNPTAASALMPIDNETHSRNVTLSLSDYYNGPPVQISGPNGQPITLGRGSRVRVRMPNSPEGVQSFINSIRQLPDPDFLVLSPPGREDGNIPVVSLQNGDTLRFGPRPNSPAGPNPPGPNPPTGPNSANGTGPAVPPGPTTPRGPTPPTGPTAPARPRTVHTTTGEITIDETGTNPAQHSITVTPRGSTAPQRFAIVGRQGIANPSTPSSLYIGELGGRRYAIPVPSEGGAAEAPIALPAATRFSGPRMNEALVYTVPDRLKIYILYPDHIVDSFSIVGTGRTPAGQDYYDVTGPFPSTTPMRFSVHSGDGVLSRIQ